MMIDPSMGWFEIAKFSTYVLDEVMIGNYEYIDKSSARVSQLVSKTLMGIYLRPRKFVSDNRSEFKKTSLLC